MTVLSSSSRPAAALDSDRNVAAFAAAIYTPKKGDRTALSRFVKKLTASNVCVGGILQEELIDSDGGKKGIYAIDITTGRRILIKRPMKDDRDCGLDVSALAKTTAIIREAINHRPDLMVIEKFGDQEQIGEGLSDEIFQTIVAGIPLLIAVPEPALDIWQERSGGLGGILPFEEDAFHKWWLSICSGHDDPGVAA